MFSACAGDTARKNLASFGNKVTERCYVLVVNGVDLVDAALADLSSRSSHSISFNHVVLHIDLDQNGMSSSVLGDPN